MAAGVRIRWFSCIGRPGTMIESTGIEWENESTAVPRDENEALTTQVTPGVLSYTPGDTHTVTAKGSFSRRPRRRQAETLRREPGGQRGGRRGWGTSMDVRPTRVCFARTGRGRETLRESGGQRDSERDSERERENDTSERERERVNGS